MVKVIVLGICASQNAQYETTNFVIDSGDSKILLDAGPGVVRQLYRAGLSATDIDLVVITHSHGDHTLGFPYFVFSNSIEKLQGKIRSDSIPVIALPEVYKGIMGMYTFCYPPGKPRSFSIENWKASSEEMKTFEFKGIKIFTMPVTHAVPTIGVRFDIGQTKFAFSSDTIYDKRMVELAKGCQVLVHEAMMTEKMKSMAAKTKHAIAAEAGKVAKEAGVQTLVLCHLYSSFIENADLLIEEARKYFDGKIIVPTELEEIKI